MQVVVRFDFKIYEEPVFMTHRVCDDYKDLYVDCVRIEGKNPAQTSADETWWVDWIVLEDVRSLCESGEMDGRNFEDYPDATAAAAMLNQCGRGVKPFGLPPDHYKRAEFREPRHHRPQGRRRQGNSAEQSGGPQPASPVSVKIEERLVEKNPTQYPEGEGLIAANPKLLCGKRIEIFLPSAPGWFPGVVTEFDEVRKDVQRNLLERECFEGMKKFEVVTHGLREHPELNNVTGQSFGGNRERQSSCQGLFPGAQRGAAEIFKSACHQRSVLQVHRRVRRRSGVDL